MDELLDSFIVSSTPNAEEITALSFILMGIQCRLDVHYPDLRLKAQFCGRSAMKLTFPDHPLEVRLIPEQTVLQHPLIRSSTSLQPSQVHALFDSEKDCEFRDASEQHPSHTCRAHFLSAELHFTLQDFGVDITSFQSFEFIQRNIEQYPLLRHLTALCSHVLCDCRYPEHSLQNPLPFHVIVWLVISYFQRTFVSCDELPTHETLLNHLIAFFEFLSGFAFESRVLSPKGPFLDYGRPDTDSDHKNKTSPLWISIGSHNIASSVDHPTWTSVVEFARSQAALLVWSNPQSGFRMLQSLLQIDRQTRTRFERNDALRRFKREFSEHYGCFWDESSEKPTLSPPAAVPIKQHLDDPGQQIPGFSNAASTPSSTQQIVDTRDADIWLSEKFPGWHTPALPSSDNHESLRRLLLAKESENNIVCTPPASHYATAAKFESHLVPEVEGPFYGFRFHDRSSCHEHGCAECQHQLPIPSPPPTRSNSFDSNAWSSVLMLQSSGSLGSSSTSSCSSGLISGMESGGRRFTNAFGKNYFTGWSSPSLETGIKETGKLWEGEILEAVVATEPYDSSLDGEGIRTPPWLALRDVSGP